MALKTKPKQRKRDGVMKDLKILGTGCPRCKKLAETAEAAAKELGFECEITRS
jgi:protein-disulfide isomerase